MKKISQFFLCAVVFAYVSVLCSSSPSDEPAGGCLAACRDALPFVQLGKRQLLSVCEPVLTVEEYMPPLVGSTLTSIYQTAFEDLRDNPEPVDTSTPQEENSPQEEEGHQEEGSSQEEYVQQWEGRPQEKEEEQTKKKQKKQKETKKEKKEEEKEIASTEYVLPARLGLRKSLESHTAITSKNSAQYRLQQKAKTDELGLRKYKKRYMVAVGTYFNAPVGVKIDVYLTSGHKLKCIVGDIKSDADTVGGLTQKNDGSVVEFIVEWRRLDRSCKRLGSMHALDEFGGYVEKIVVYEE